VKLGSLQQARYDARIDQLRELQARFRPAEQGNRLFQLADQRHAFCPRRQLLVAIAQGAFRPTMPASTSYVSYRPASAPTKKCKETP
jgi:hypothetical protein